MTQNFLSLFETKSAYMATLKREFFFPFARGRQGLMGHDLSFKQWGYGKTAKAMKGWANKVPEALLTFLLHFMLKSCALFKSQRSLKSRLKRTWTQDTVNSEKRNCNVRGSRSWTWMFFTLCTQLQLLQLLTKIKAFSLSKSFPFHSSNAITFMYSLLWLTFLTTAPLIASFTITGRSH